MWRVPVRVCDVFVCVAGWTGQRLKQADSHIWRNLFDPEPAILENMMTGEKKTKDEIESCSCLVLSFSQRMSDKSFLNQLFPLSDSTNMHSVQADLMLSFI